MTCILAGNAYTQLSISAGSSYRIGSSNSDRDEAAGTTYNTLRTPFMFASVDLRKGNYMFTGDLTYQHNNFYFKNKKTDVLYGSHGGSQTTNTQYLNARILSGYAGLKLSASRILRPEKKLNLLLGFFGNVDFLLLEKESNFMRIHTIHFSGWQDPNVKILSTSTDPFNAVTLDNVRYLLGFQIKPRYNFGDFFAEMNISLGISPSFNIYTETNPPTTAFIEGGLKAGYTFR